jgi:hypothetical protein
LGEVSSPWPRETAHGHGREEANAGVERALALPAA